MDFELNGNDMYHSHSRYAICYHISLGKCQFDHSSGGISPLKVLMGLYETSVTMF